MSLNEPGMASLNTTPTIQRTTLEAEAWVNEMEAAGAPTALVTRWRSEVTAQKARDAAMANEHIEQAMERVRLAGTAADERFTLVIGEAKIIRDALRSGVIDHNEGRAEWKRLGREFGVGDGANGRAIEAAETMCQIEDDPYGWADRLYSAHKSIQPTFSF